MGHASGPYGGCAQCKEQKAISSANHYNGPHYISSIVYIYIYLALFSICIYSIELPNISFFVYTICLATARHTRAEQGPMAL